MRAFLVGTQPMLISCVWSGPGKLWAQANWRGKKLTASAGLNATLLCNSLWCKYPPY